MRSISISSILLPIRRKLRKNQQLYRFLGHFYGLYWNLPMALGRLAGYDDGTVVFSSFHCRNYNDSPRYISELLHAQHPEIRIVWLFEDVEAARKRFAIPDYVQVYGTNSLRGILALGRARVVVDNFRKHFYLAFPGRNQVYVQTWHGDRPFKKIGYDDPSFNFLMREEFSTLGVTGSEFGRNLFRTAFHCRGELMMEGCPRNDILVQNDPALCAEVRARLGLDAGTGVLLYAPTFRDTAVKSKRPLAVSLDLHRVLDALERNTGKPWKCLLRAHYFTAGLDVQETSDRLIPVSDYPEMSELLLISDALLTDYSSCASDFAILRRPVYLYQDDVEEYQSRDRAFYLPMSAYDFWIAHTPEELEALIEQTTPERAAENCDKVIAFYGMNETGHATQSVVDYIVSKLK